MGAPGATQFYRLPSIRQFIQLLEDDVLDRRSILALFPDGVDVRALWEQLRGLLVRRDFLLEEVDVGDIPPDRMLLAAMGEALRLTLPAGQSHWSLERLYQEAREQSQVVTLVSIERLSADRQAQWLQLLTQWANFSQREADAGRDIVSLIVCVSATALLDRLPTSDLMLSVRWWWQLPSHLEMRLLCQSGSAAYHHTSPPSLWREFILASLAGDDLGVIQGLWEEDIILDEATALKRLRVMATARGWCLQDVTQVESVLFQALPDDWVKDTAPPPALRNAWARGLLSSCPEYGIELHVAALALAGRTEALSQRLWRGQAQYLLPLIDQVRLRLCVYLTQEYKTGWATRWALPLSEEERAAVRKSSLSCEWGYLEYLIRTYVHLRRERRWLTLIVQCRAVRNQIAHYSPISYDAFLALWAELKRAANELPR